MTGYRIRTALFAIVTAAVIANVGVFGDSETGRWIALGMRSAASAAAIVYGLIVVRRVSGVNRWWRLLAVAAVACLWIGELEWLLGGRSSWWAAAAYFAFLAFALAAVLTIAHGCGDVIRRWVRTGVASIVTTVLDGLVAAISFTVLVLLGNLGAQSSASLPRSGSPGIEAVFAVVELAVVVIAAVIGMVYEPDRPCRSNYLLLGSGVVLIGSADRIVAYFAAVDPSRGALTAGLGFVLGPLLIGYSLREGHDERPTGAGLRPMDWAQLTLPYAGFLGVTVLLAVHLLTGHQLRPGEIAATVTMVIFVAVRQVLVTAAQRVLTRRLYESQRRLAHQVLHDALTGLPNRSYFARRLNEAMHSSRFVLIFVDLDDFKEVNDRFGHAAGDELLCAVGERLARCVAERDMLARIGGDEFAVLVDGDSEAPELVAERLRVALREPFPVQGSSVRVRASMGLVRPGVGGATQTSDDLLRQADVSMYAGKRLGKDTAVVYHPSAAVGTDFPTALRMAGGDLPAGFGLVYQPIVHLPRETPVAVEALARWTAPNGTDIPPQTFVAVAEAAGLGAVLDALVLNGACRDVRDAGLEVDIHVNIGAARLGNLDFEQRLWRTLERHGVPPSRLVLEITETVPIVDLVDAEAQIRRLSASGVRVALDDFGAGYNSLTYLHSLPVQIVKLDRSLAVIADRDRDSALYRSVVGLCRELHISVVAEGIESREQAETVFAAGCSLVQGHLFGWPAPITDVAQRWRGGRLGEPTQFASDSG